MISDNAHIEYFRKTPEQAAVLPPPLPEDLQSSSAELKELLEPLERAFIKPNLRFHGIHHGASSAILAATIHEVVPFPRDSRAKVASIIAAYLQDSRRVGDWELNQIPHARRGKDFLLNHGQELLPDVEGSLLTAAAIAIGGHSLTFSREKERRNYRAEFATLNTQALTARLTALTLTKTVALTLQEADAMDGIRRYYVGGIVSRMLRTAARMHDRLTMTHEIRKQLIFPQAAGLIVYADAMNQAARSEPLRRQFKNDALGATLEAGKLIGLLKA